jgi:transcriptional regulator of arginine metabolism
MKIQRHAAILRVVRDRRIESQDELRGALASEGFIVTQATLSRDIRELRLVKVPAADGMGHYSLPEEWESTPPLESLLPTLFRSVDGVDHLLVIHTLTGAAQTVAAAIDWEEWPEVVGTLAGDDTILIIVRDAAAVPELRGRIERMAGLEPG